MNEDNVSYTDIEAMNLTSGIPPRDFKTHHLTPRPYNKSNTLSKLVQQQLIHTWGTICQRVEWTAYKSQTFNGASVEVWERISNFIPHFIKDVITYPHWEYS